MGDSSVLFLEAGSGKIGLLLRAIGLCLFAYIISNLDLNKAFYYWQQADRARLLAALSFIPLLYLVKAWRWQFLLSMSRVDFPLRKCFSAYIIGVTMGMVTPGRVGELFKLMYLRDEKQNMPRSLLGVVLDRVSDFAALAAIALMSTTAVCADLLPEGTMFLSSFLCTGAVVVFIWKGRALVAYLGSRIGNLPLLRQFDDPATLGDMQKPSAIYWISFMAVALSFIGWLLYFLMYLVMLEALGIQLSFSQLMCSSSLATMITLLPISLAGIGTRDAVLILIFERIGIAQEAALAFSALILFNYLLVALWGGILWARHPVKWRRTEAGLW